MKKPLLTFILLTLVNLANAEWNSMEQSQISDCKFKKAHITFKGDLNEVPVFFSSNLEESIQGVICPEKSKVSSFKYEYTRYCNLMISRKQKQSTCEYYCPNSVANVQMICTLNN